MLHPIHQRFEQRNGRWTVATSTVLYAGSEVEAQETTGFSGAERASDRLDIVNGARRGNDVVGDTVPDDGFAAPVGES